MKAIEMLDKIKELRARTNVSMKTCKEVLEKCDFDVERAISYLRSNQIIKNENVSKNKAKQGVIASYIHHNQKVGCIVELRCQTDFVTRSKEFKKLAEDIAVHIVACNPKYVSRDEIPIDWIDGERSIAKCQIKDCEKKPEKLLEKIIDGKMNSVFQNNCLIEQKFVKDEKITIQQLINDSINKFQENIFVQNFHILRVDV